MGLDQKRIIRKGDIVLHKLSGLYYICENQKMERWMNMNPYYRISPKEAVSPDYFKKN